MGELGSNQVTKEEFVTHEFDPFKDQTTTRLNNPTMFEAGKLATYIMNMERFQSASEGEFDVPRLTIVGQTEPKDHSTTLDLWGTLQISEVIFNCDQENIVCEEKWGNVPDTVDQSVGDWERYIAVNECLILLESSEQLLKIASAKELEIRVVTKSGYVDLSDNEEKIFQDMAKLFYNQVYDKEMFKDDLDEAKEFSSKLQENLEKSEGGGCFVATAVYGTYRHPDLTVLRGFRDNYLRQTSFGRRFISMYYKYGPSLANFVKRSYLLRLVFAIPVKALTYIVKLTGFDQGSVSKP